MFQHCEIQFNSVTRKIRILINNYVFGYILFVYRRFSIGSKIFMKIHHGSAQNTHFKNNIDYATIFVFHQ